MELQAAKEKIRLIFLQDSKNIDLAPGIQRFRNGISKHATPALFDNIDTFSQALRKSLKLLPPGAPAPKLLPYLCDRDAQFKLIESTLWTRTERALDRPAVFIIHGDICQCGEQFVEVMGKYKMSGVKYIELTWQKHRGSWEGEILRELSQELLGKPDLNRSRITDALLHVSSPILMHTFLSTSDWEQGGEAALRAFLDFWNAWKELRRTTPLVICVRVRYQIENSLYRFLYKRSLTLTNDTIRRFLSGWPTVPWNDAERLMSPVEPWSSLIFHVLPELSRIDEPAALRWSRLGEVREFTGGKSLEDDITSLYGKKFRSEPDQSPKMDRLAKELDRLL
jgi:hypothetical protein